MPQSETFSDFVQFSAKTFCDSVHFVVKTFCDSVQIEYVCAVL